MYLNEIPHKELLERILDKEILNIDVSYDYPNNIMSKIYFNINGLLPTANIEKALFLQKMKTILTEDGLFIKTIPFREGDQLLWKAKSSMTNGKYIGETELEASLSLVHDLQK